MLLLTVVLPLSLLHTQSYNFVGFTSTVSSGLSAAAKTVVQQALAKLVAVDTAAVTITNTRSAAAPVVGTYVSFDIVVANQAAAKTAKSTLADKLDKARRS